MERAEAALQRIRYVLLASSGASIGFSFVRSESDKFVSVGDIFWLLAVLFWAASFAVGIFAIRQDSFHKLAEYIQNADRAELVQRHREKYGGGINTLSSILSRSDIFDRKQSKVYSSALDNWQLVLYFVGGVAFGLLQVSEHFAADFVLFDYSVDFVGEAIGSHSSPTQVPK